jgi:hypothetical protein
MGLTEVPCELFRMKNLKVLYLHNNNLCSLPSKVAHLTTLEQLWVRLSKRLDRELTKNHVVQVFDNKLTSLPPELGLLTNLKWLYVRHSRQMDLDLTLRRRAFRSATTSSRRSPQKSASCDSSNNSTYEGRIEWIMI